MQLSSSILNGNNLTKTEEYEKDIYNDCLCPDAVCFLPEAAAC
jgi:hypothetical protein